MRPLCKCKQRPAAINYKKAEYFDEYYPFFEEVYTKKWDTLTEITEYMLKWFLK